MHFYNACIPAWHNTYILHDIFLVSENLCFLLLVAICFLEWMVANTCDDRIFVINSTIHFALVIKEILDSPSQNNCYVLEFGQSAFEFNYSETINATVNMILWEQEL